MCVGTDSLMATMEVAAEGLCGTFYRTATSRAGYSFKEFGGLWDTSSS